MGKIPQIIIPFFKHIGHIGDIEHIGAGHIGEHTHYKGYRTRRGTLFLHAKSFKTID
jgi:hypothetical protein